MNILIIIFLTIILIVLMIGTVRLICDPASNILDFFMNLFLIDWLIDLISYIVMAIGDLLD